MQIRFKKEIKENEKITPKDLIEIILKTRGIKNPEEFLNPLPVSKISLEDFGFKAQIKKTIKILEKIKKEEGMIIVYTDYDADGITGGAILWETLNLLGFKVMPYVPHRKKEGYGFSKIGIDNIKRLYNPALIISVDHGISAKDKIKYAKSIGIQVIVTDHHLKPEVLPECEAIFHIPELSGSGVAYFFAKEIYMAFKSTMSLRGTSGDEAYSPGKREIPTGSPRSSDVTSDSLAMTTLKNNFEIDYLALASIGTIADLVPLTGVSRSLVKYGLEAFINIKREGIRHLLKEAGIEGRKITPYEVGFIIAPRINAVGRLEHAIDALRLLCTKKSEIAHNLACKVGEKNTERQDLVKKAVEQAIKQVENSKLKVQSLKKIIILVSDNWHEGIIGLIASKICEKYYRPVIVMTKSDGFLKGSARSTPNFHITDFLRENKKFLIDVGGHKQAAGFTMEAGKLQNFVKALEKKADKIIKEKNLEKIIEADLKMPISKINLALVRSIESLNPYGIGNPQPTFYSQGEILMAKLFGKKQEHLKLYVKTEKIGSFPLELIMFSGADRFVKLSRGQIVDLVYKLEIDTWSGVERIRGRVEYIDV